MGSQNICDAVEKSGVTLTNYDVVYLGYAGRDEDMTLSPKEFKEMKQDHLLMIDEQGFGVNPLTWDRISGGARFAGVEQWKEYVIGNILPCRSHDELREGLARRPMLYLSLDETKASDVELISTAYRNRDKLSTSDRQRLLERLREKGSQSSVIGELVKVEEEFALSLVPKADMTDAYPMMRKILKVKPFLLQKLPQGQNHLLLLKMVAKQDGMALMFVGDKIVNDRATCEKLLLTAIETTPNLIKVPRFSPYRNSIPFAVKAVKVDRGVYKQLSKKMQQRPEVIAAYLDAYGLDAFDEMPELKQQLKTDEAFARDLLGRLKNGRVGDCISGIIRSSHF